MSCPVGASSSASYYPRTKIGSLGFNYRTVATYTIVISDCSHSCPLTGDPTCSNLLYRPPTLEKTTHNYVDSSGSQVHVVSLVLGYLHLPHPLQERETKDPFVLYGQSYSALRMDVTEATIGKKFEQLSEALKVL